MTKSYLSFFLTIPFFFLFTSCDKDDLYNSGDDANLEDEVLYLTVWEYDIFNGQNLKSGSFWDYYKRGITGSALAYSHDSDTDEEYLFAYEIIPQQNNHHVYFTENGSGENEKKFEYIMEGEKLSELKIFYQESVISQFKFSYNAGKLVKVMQGNTEVIGDITYDSFGNIIKLSVIGVSCPKFHFKICESKNPYKGVFRNFNINNLHTESLYSIISFLNPNFVLDIISTSNDDFDWDSHNTSISAEVNENNYPHIIRERKFDTQGNLVHNKIIAEYEYH